MIFFDVMASVDATEWFSDEGRDFAYCMSYAPFQHREACEFILHIHRDDEDLHRAKVKHMHDFGCTDTFIQAYVDAKAAGAQRVLFYAG